MFFPTSEGADDGRSISRLRLGYAGPDGCVEPHLSVDGMTPMGPNLSHWPGNRTPPQWKADLSTEIALRFARASPGEQAAFLGGVELVVNDHFDTDGFASLLAVLRPELAFKREELLLSAAATGDYGMLRSRRGFAIDRIVNRIADDASPVRGAFTVVHDESQMPLAKYAWLLEHAESVLDHHGSYRALYEEELATVQQQIDESLRGAMKLRRFEQLGLAVVETEGPRHRMTLNTLAGAYRVLHVMTGASGPRYRYHDRTESWFELVTFRPLPRRDLRPLAATLADLEPERDGASWNADAPTTPIPELYFGVPSEQEYGAITRELRPSSLRPAQVADAFAAFFAGPPS